MLLAEEAATSVSNFHTFDIFVILFTIVIAVAFLRQLAAPVKNKFAIGFAAVSLLVFLLVDILMIQGWMK